VRAQRAFESLDKGKAMPFRNKTVLITGGTGSFGRAAAKKLLLEKLCAKVIIFSRDEWKQWDMQQSDPIFDHPNIRYFLGDIRDSGRLARAFNGVDIVIHAAALKQVPAAEYNPTEFIKTNVLGAMNIIDNAIDRGVQKVIALSTDKSVNPINLYGATKLCADKLFIAANSYVGVKGFPIFSVVRYGNVLGSRGSLIPLWKKMIAEGVTALPVTDKRMTRFWISIDESVNFVIDKINMMHGGEIYVPKIPSIKILDLAKAMAPKLPIEIIGIREGEKLHELLVSQEEARFAAELKDAFVILPPVFKSEFSQRLAKLHEKGVLVPPNFSYGSNNNPEWIEGDEIRKMLKKHGF